MAITLTSDSKALDHSISSVTDTALSELLSVSKQWAATIDSHFKTANAHGPGTNPTGQQQQDDPVLRKVGQIKDLLEKGQDTDKEANDKIRGEVDAYLKDLSPTARLEILQTVDKETSGAPGVDLQIYDVDPITGRVTYELGSQKHVTPDRGGSVMNLQTTWTVPDQAQKSTVWLDPKTGHSVVKMQDIGVNEGSVSNNCYLPDGSEISRQRVWTDSGAPLDDNFDEMVVNNKTIGYRYVTGEQYGDMRDPKPFTGKSTADKFDSKGRPTEYLVQNGKVHVEYDARGFMKDLTVPTDNPANSIHFQQSKLNDFGYDYDVVSKDSDGEHSDATSGAPRIDPDGTVTYDEAHSISDPMPTGSKKILANGDTATTDFTGTVEVGYDGKVQRDGSDDPFSQTTVTVTQHQKTGGYSIGVDYRSGTTATVEYSKPDLGNPPDESKDGNPVQLNIESPGGSITFALQSDGTVKRLTTDQSKKVTESKVTKQEFDRLSNYVLTQKDDLAVVWNKPGKSKEPFELKGDTWLSDLESAYRKYVVPYEFQS